MTGNLGLQAALALFPIALGGTLLVGFRVPAKHAMPAAYIAAAVVALGFWRMSAARVAAPSARPSVRPCTASFSHVKSSRRCRRKISRSARPVMPAPMVSGAATSRPSRKPWGWPVG